MGLNMEIYIERRKFIQEHETVSILLEDSYATLSYESGGTNNFVEGKCESVEKNISIDEYNKICNSLLSLNYSGILKENENVLVLHPHVITVKLSTGSAKVVFEVNEQSKLDSSPETRKFLEIYKTIFDLFNIT